MHKINKQKKNKTNFARPKSNLDFQLLPLKSNGVSRSTEGCGLN